MISVTKRRDMHELAGKGIYKVEQYDQYPHYGNLFPYFS